MSKNIKILCSSDYPILFKFCLLVVKIVSKESQIVLLATAMETWKSVNAKLRVKSWCSNRVFFVTVTNADIGSLKIHFQFHNKCLFHNLAKFEHYRIILTRWNVQIFGQKGVIYFQQTVDAIVEIFLSLNQSFDAKILIKRLPSFSVLKFTVIRRM